jgi:hypothetical protein
LKKGSYMASFFDQFVGEPPKRFTQWLRQKNCVCIYTIQSRQRTSILQWDLEGGRRIGIFLVKLDVAIFDRNENTNKRTPKNLALTGWWMDVDA